MIAKVFKHYAIPLTITEGIRATFRSKLWRMGKRFSKFGSKRRSQQLSSWKDGKDAIWNFTVPECEVNLQLLRKRSIETRLGEESTKRIKLEKEVKALQNSVNNQAQVISRLRSGKPEHCRGSSSKLWTAYSRQQQYNKKKKIAHGVKGALSFCENERFKVCSVEVENVDTGNREVLCIANGTFSKAKEKTTSTEDKVCSSLYVKDRFSVSNEAFHELSMVSDLPTSFQVKKMTKALNSKFEIRSIGTIGVQQSLRTCLAIRLTKLVEQSYLPISSVIRVKLTGDGTQIARGLTVVNIAFTILEERQRACSASGNHYFKGV